MRTTSVLIALLAVSSPCLAASPAPTPAAAPKPTAASASAPAPRARTGFGQAIAELTRNMQQSRTASAPASGTSKEGARSAGTTTVTSADATSL